MKDEVAELVKHARLKNVLLEAVGRRGRTARLREAAERVMRLSDPGTPERLVTLVQVAADTGMPASDIVSEICRTTERASKP